MNLGTAFHTEPRDACFAAVLLKRERGLAATLRRILDSHVKKNEPPADMPQFFSCDMRSPSVDGTVLYVLYGTMTSACLLFHTRFDPKR